MLIIGMAQAQPEQQNTIFFEIVKTVRYFAVNGVPVDATAINQPLVNTLGMQSMSREQLVERL